MAYTLKSTTTNMLTDNKIISSHVSWSSSSEKFVLDQLELPLAHLTLCFSLAQPDHYFSPQCLSD